jgi:putative FmdB family regulatory protein
MPTYDYKCLDCEHTFEKFESIKADPLTDCPECEGTVKRLIGGGGGFIFKGSGFYITDYRKDGYAADKKAAESQPSEADGGCGKAECGAGSSTSCASTDSPSTSSSSTSDSSSTSSSSSTPASE